MTDEIQNALLEACGALAAIGLLASKMTDEERTTARREIDRLYAQILRAKQALANANPNG